MTVYLTADAEADIEEICDYVETADSPEAAERVFAALKVAVLGLGDTPRRGRIVPELRRISVSEYREVLYKPYRIMYQLQGSRVYVIAVLDGRRDLQELLQQRLLRTS